ncbi:MAG: undecaprenyldiphospho-muramoylpentapeptide beta-N-acetylglucosaminyltransferase [Burkholderiales bacterium]|nr:undecaprenyldiphospho-muramoylpentapeptide beta-N-acetylglucosaminyltransferase [Burkholderiales bacterium]
MPARTLMIMAGGTGGHVFPALAVAERLRASGWRIVWLGSRAGMEARLVASRGYPMAYADFAGLRGGGVAAWALLPLRLVRALWQAAAAIFTHRPDVLLGMGGFQSFPGAAVAVLLRRPLAIHEQNAVAGLANRVLARFAARVLAGFPGALAGAAAVGNPVRAEIACLPAPKERYAGRSGPLRLLAIGGSRGAQALNEVMPAALAALPAGSRARVRHQSGAGRAAALAAAYRAAGIEAEVEEFVDDMAGAYRDADLVVCRAGAATVAELAAAGVASVLVPYPHAVDDHQSANARYLSQAQAAILLPQGEFTPARLAQILRGLDRETLLAMAARARARAKPDATEALARACMELAP